MRWPGSYALARFSRTREALRSDGSQIGTTDHGHGSAEAGVRRRHFSDVAGLRLRWLPSLGEEHALLERQKLLVPAPQDDPSWSAIVLDVTAESGNGEQGVGHR